MQVALTAEDASDWSYRGEGAANIVLEYTGTSPSFIGKVLRVPKAEVSGGCGPATSGVSEHERELWKDLDGVAEATSREVASRLFAARVMRPLLGPEHVDAGRPIVVTREFLLSVEKNIDDQRPSWRIDAAKIDVLCDRALLISDHSVFPEVISGRGICVAVEIKPKCGFLPSSKFIRKGHAAKTCVSRFKMHQVLKLHQGEIVRMSEYDPLDLFSGSRSRIKQAIRALFATPQNNIRVFFNGSIIFGALGGANRSESTVDSYEKYEILEDSLKVLIQADHGQRLASFQELITETVFKSGIVNDLLQAQKLDTIDIEGVIHAYYNVTSEPCLVCKNLNDSELCCKYSSLHSLSLKESAKIVKEYLIASTAKDCSLIISFKPSGIVDGTLCRSIVLGSNNQRFDYKAAFIDLDMKPLKKTIYYYELDKKIVDLYSKLESF